MATIKETLVQPTTVMGIATAVGSIAMIVAHVLTHDTTITMAAGGAAGSLMAIFLPDNSTAKSSVEKLVSDAVSAAVQKRIMSALPMLIADGMSVVSAIQTTSMPAVVSVVQTTPAAPAMTTTTTTTGAPA